MTFLGQAAPPAPAPIPATKPDVRPRPATQLETAAWIRMKHMFLNQLRPSVQATLNSAEAAATMQLWFNQRGIPIDAWTYALQADLDQLLNRYNTLDRIIAGAEAEKYFTCLENGDLTIFAPAGMPEEQYIEDRYPGAFGIAWVPIVIGIALIVGCITTIAGIEFFSKSANRRQQNQIMKAAAEMAAQPRAVRDAYTKMLQANADVFERTKTEEGESLLAKLLGEKPAGALAIAAIVGVAAWAFSQVAPAVQRMREKSERKAA